MKSTRKTAITVGILFIIGTVSGILSLVFLGPFLDNPQYISSLAVNQNKIVIGSLLILTMGFALTMVPVVLYPIFKKFNPTLALGAVVFRGALEAVVYMAQAVVWLVLLSLSQEYAAAGSTADTANFQQIGTLILNLDTWLADILSIVFSLGALMIYYIFYQSKLIPRWLSVWGLVGAVLYFADPLLGMFGFEWGFLILPLAVQEMVLALWLIIKGFDPTAIASVSTG